MVSKSEDSWGGKWTLEKLSILEKYLDAYTTALKNTPFNLMYIDAFAGTGQLNLPEELKQDALNTQNFIRGSAPRALEIGNKEFDKLIFVEKDDSMCNELRGLREQHSSREIIIENSDANDFLLDLEQDWSKWRGVLFLDPFSTHVEWSTIQKIESFKALDTWILFPTFVIVRMLPRSRKPEEIEQAWKDRLTKVYGDTSWENLYGENPQGDLFGYTEQVRSKGIEGLIRTYKENLRALFGDRFLEKSRTLKNSQGSPLFEFLFCAGNPAGVRPAKRIAKHILEHI